MENLEEITEEGLSQSVSEYMEPGEMIAVDHFLKEFNDLFARVLQADILKNSSKTAIGMSYWSRMEEFLEDVFGKEKFENEVRPLQKRIKERLGL